ncbi:hypothetical protein BKA63DRAFT_205624 [Paraphoma chrysanthemicola]|nr:hypothetical protein BKA63DRAFT_205624 [Paraphoma chrysanthemicola]
MLWTCLLLALTPAAQAAMQSLRFSCSSLVTERVDPIVAPGKPQSSHLHHITGGNGFNTSMDFAEDPALRATCSSCTFTEDKSNYWTPTMFYRARNGTFKRVPVKTNGFKGANGGMTVYYQNRFDGTRVDTTAFQKGFRMTTGSPLYKSANDVKPNRGQLSFTCIDAAGTRSAQTPDFPKTACGTGIMVNVNFPSCWDGKNLDSADHRSHMSYSAIKAAPCPASHPVKIPRILLETVWDTSAFNNKADWPTDGSQPFVWSFGDKLGYGNHGDYVFGWEGDSLQRAMDADCNNMNCPTLKSQAITAANSCVLQQKVKEEIDGWLAQLPGSNPVV